MRINKFLCLFFVLSMFVPCYAAELLDIKIDKHKYYDNLLIETSEYSKAKVTLLDNPPRLVIDFKGTKAGGKTGYNLNSARIEKVRVGQFEENTARVVVDLKELADYENASIFGKNETIIEIRDRSRPSIYTAAKPPPPSEVSSSALPGLKAQKISPQIVKVERVIVKNGDQPAKKRGGPSVLKGKVIVVDPGHGGSDPGAFGLYGLVEKDATLKAAYKLVGFLKQSGATVYLTRKQNIKIDLKGVVDFTNRVKPDVYIGIHFNATYNRNINGTETYYYTRRSYKLAEILHRNIRKKLGRPDRGVRRARLYTVHHANMPAVIVEPAYLTNYAEARLLTSDSFLKGVAWGITSGLKEYFECRK